MKKLFYLLTIACLSLCPKAKADIRLPEPTIKEYAEIMDQTYEALCKQAHYVLTKVKAHHGNPTMKLLTKSMHGEHGIRPNTGAIFGFSFLYRFGNYRSDLVGVERDALLKDFIEPMMNYITTTYDSIPTDDGKCWRNQWQSAHWAYSLGKAAWYLGEDLSENLRNEICRIVKAEARRFYEIEPPHRVKMDTAAEENAWNSQIFHVALLLMPDDPDCERWKRLFDKWVVSSYVTQKDMDEGKMVGDLNVNQFGGPNIYDDYTLENHGIVHPDYMSAFMLSVQTMIDYKMQNKEIPASLRYNVQPMYENLKWFTLCDGGMTYPSWQDWGLFRNPDWFIHHIYMAVFFKYTDGLAYARSVLNCIKKMQQRHAAGNVYGEEEYFFPSTQYDLMICLAQSWQALHYMPANQDRLREKTGVKHMENGKIILNRTPKFIHSLSYGNKLMFTPTLNRMDRLFDSYPTNGIGRIRLKDGQKDLKVSLKDIRITTHTKEFQVEMKIEHGDAVQADYVIKACNGKLKVKEALRALRDCEVALISTSEYGILNNKNWIYENGSRQISGKGMKKTYHSLSGNSEDILQDKFIIDGVKFNCHRTADAFHAHYAGAKKYRNARATDVLSLNYSETGKKYNQGEVISTLEYTISY